MGARYSCVISQLPLECLSSVISLTSPRDACRCSAVSTNFKLAADADAVWEHFLPPDLDHILSRSEDQLVFTSKKDLYLLLSNRDIILDHGNLSFRLDRSSGAKIYMLSASRSAKIVWSDNPQYWQLLSPNRDSRFSEVARLIIVWWLKINASFNCKILTLKTNYTAYFVFKLEDDSSGLDLPIDALIDFGEQEARRKICLQQLSSSSTRQIPNNAIKYPRVRDDGWSEVEIGEFYYDCEDDGDVEFEVREIKGLWAKRGLLFYGIEIRPKKEQTA